MCAWREPRSEINIHTHPSVSGGNREARSIYIHIHVCLAGIAKRNQFTYTSMCAWWESRSEINGKCHRRRHRSHESHEKYIYMHIHIQTHTYIYIHVCLAGIAKRNQWEISHTGATGAIRHTRAIAGNREAKSMLNYCSKTFRF